MTGVLIVRGFIFFIIICLTAYFVLPRTRWNHLIQLDTTTFAITHLFGIVYALCSLLILILAPTVLVADNLWLVLVIPYVVLTFYWLMARRQYRVPKRVEDKRILDTAKIASILLVFSFVGMVIVLMLYQNNISGGKIWLPLYIFISMLINSAVSLIMFKRL